MANSSTVENLVRMISTWNELAKKPAELVFAKTLYHDFRILDQVVAENPGLGRRWQKDLVAGLHQALSSLQPEVAFIQSYYPHLHARLLNATTPDQSGAYDVSQLTSAISDMLAEIQFTTYLTNLCDELATICSTSSDMKEKIDSLVQVLLVRLVEIASGSMLEKHASAVLSRFVVELYRPQLEAALEEDQARHNLIELIESLGTSRILIIPKTW